MNSTQKPKEELEWDSRTQICFFQAMDGLKPVGINRFFKMASIHERFCNSINKQITSQPIWDFLESLYDMNALHESETLPFLEEDVEFSLPREFDEIAKERFGVSISNADTNEKDLKTSKNNGFLKPKLVQVASNSSKSRDQPSATSPNLKITKGSFKSEQNESNDATNSKSKADASKLGKRKHSSSPSKTTKSEAPPLQTKVDLMDAQVRLKHEATLSNKTKSEPHSPSRLSKQESSVSSKNTKQENSKPIQDGLSFNKTSKVDITRLKMSKFEGNDVSKSPSSSKLTKHETQSSPKNVKQEINFSTRGNKHELKKVSHEKERTSESVKKHRDASSTTKKSHHNSDSSVTTRNSKGENVVTKKKSDSNSSKKDETPIRSKSDSKESQNSKADGSNSTGYGKTRMQVKSELAESAKKRKLQKLDDSPSAKKKSSPLVKRRR